MSRPVFHGRVLTWSEAALCIHSCMWCHNESKPGEPFYIVRYFGSRDGPVGHGGRSAQAAWRSAYEYLSTKEKAL